MNRMSVLIWSFGLIVLQSVLFMWNKALLDEYTLPASVDSVR